MTFLNPGFLWALPLALVPLVIHLINIRPYKVVYFSHLRFLQNIRQQQRTRNILKEILVLLMRMLAIAALVLAFARPVKYKSKNIKPCNGVVVYLDNSFSMTARGAKGINLEVAKNQIVELMKLFPRSTEFMILTNDLLPQEQRFYTQSFAKDLVLSVQASPNSKKLSFITEKIRNLISDDTTCNPYVFVFSDFQKTTADLHKARFPANWQVFFALLQPQNPANVSLDTAFFASPYHIRDMKDSLIFTLKNYSDRPQKDFKVSLYINDTLKALTTLNLDAQCAKVFGFSFVNQSYGWNSGYLVISDLPVTFDDTLFFSYFVKNQFDILLISDKNDKYLKAFYSQQPFVLKQVSPSAIPYSGFAKYSAIIIDGISDYSSGLIDALKSYLENGGAVCVIPPHNPADANSLLTSLGLPGFVRVDTQNTRISYVNMQSFIYRDALESYEDNELMPQIKVYGYRKPDFSIEEPLLTAKNGVTMLSRAAIGQGNLYILSFALDDSVTNFMLNPLFVPTFYNLAVFSSANYRMYYVLSKDNTIKIPRPSKSEYLRLTGNGREFIPPSRYVGQFLLLDISFLNLKAGNYNVLSGDSSVARVSLNYWRAESDPAFFTRKQINKIINDRKLHNIRTFDLNRKNIDNVVKNEISAQKVWKIFIILALLFLFAEILINRLL